MNQASSMLEKWYIPSNIHGALFTVSLYGWMRPYRMAEIIFESMGMLYGEGGQLHTAL
jgi:hypothetical protein